MHIEESFISNNIEKLHKVGKKIIHLKHNIKYLEVCSLFKVAPQGLRIKKIPRIVRLQLILEKIGIAF